MDTDPFVIVGGGQAGAWIAKTLRAEGYFGAIMLIAAEPHEPYERPPLSKAVLSDPSRMAESVLLSREQATASAVEIRFDTRAVALDPVRRELALQDGSVLRYATLFLTTGSRPRTPDWFVASSRCHTLRTLDDAIALHATLKSAGRLLIVGGGWIGLEVAATARTMGVACTVIEAAERVCVRSVPPEVSAWLTQEHRAHEVELVAGVTPVTAIESDAGVALTLSNGAVLTGDALLVGIGSVPEVGLAETGGLTIGNGIVVDAACRTSDPNVYAAGDVTSFHCSFSGGPVRRESWSNAQNQAIAAAKAALGQAVHYAELPWLWSDQYGRHLQMLGTPERAVRVEHQSASSGDGHFWSCFDAAGSLVGAVGVDAQRDLRGMRKTLAGAVAR